MDRLDEDQANTRKPSLSQLFLSFLKLGATAFGGPAMVAYIRKMSVDQNRWLDKESFQHGVALCQTIPGATAMQASAYVGLKARGVAGAAVSFVGFGLPAFLFMMILSALYVQTHTQPRVVSAFNGLQVMIVAIVANAAISFGRNTLKRLGDVIIALLAAGMFGWGVNPVLVILLTALVGLLLRDRSLGAKTILGSTTQPEFPKSIVFILAGAATVATLLFLFQRGLFDLAALMIRIDLFAFGGGFASVPLMFHEVVKVRAWMDGPTFLNGIALGQVTPGPIVITATFVGYLVRGALGGLIATVSIFLPSFLMVIGTAPYLERWRSSPYFNRAINGILCSFVGLLITVTVRFALPIPWSFPRVVLAMGALVALLLKVDVLWIVLVGTVISLFVL